MGDLSNMVQRKVPLPMAGGGNWVILNVPSNPKPFHESIRRETQEQASNVDGSDEVEEIKASLQRTAPARVKCLKAS